jgi:hypothetical protein
MPEQLRMFFIGASPATDGTFSCDANSIVYQATHELSSR